MADGAVDERLLQLAREALQCSRGPWWDKAQAILSLSSWRPQSEDSEKIEFIRAFVPGKLPYNYAREIIDTNIRTWMNAAAEEAGSSSEVIANTLKNGQLALDDLMEALVESGVVDDRGGDEVNRSTGKMVEGLVDYLRKAGYWEAPRQVKGISFRELNDGFVDEAINEIVTFRLDCGYAGYHELEHMIDCMFEDVAINVSLAIENRYTSLVDMPLLEVNLTDVLSEFSGLIELDGKLLCVLDNCEFRLPPKAVYDECRNRYVEALEDMGLETTPTQHSPHTEAVRNPKKESFYSRAIDMNVELWAEICNREKYYAVIQAVEVGKLPKFKSI